MNVGDKVRFLDSVGGGIHFSHCGEIPDGVLHLLAVVFPESNVQLLIQVVLYGPMLSNYRGDFLRICVVQ